MANLVTGISGASALTENQFLRLLHAITQKSGVFDLASHWKVGVANPLSNKVVVPVGDGVFKFSGKTLHGYSTTDFEVTVSANNSGTNRISTIIAYLNIGATVNSDGSNILIFTSVDGTPDASPVIPTDTQISNAIGANKPFVRLSNLALPTGYSQIGASMITDVRPSCLFSFLGGLNLSEQTLIDTPDTAKANVVLKNNGSKSRLFIKGVSDTNPIEIQSIDEPVDDGGATSALDFGIKCHTVTLTTNKAITLSNVAVGKGVYLRFVQAGTGGYTPTFGSLPILWAGGAIPDFSDVVGQTDAIFLFCYKKVGSVYYFDGGSVAGQLA